MTVGTSERPLKVAVVGAGPSGFYAAGALLGSDRAVKVDLIDRLPTPFGLVRGGVAPDHQNIKVVVKAYERTARTPGFRFVGGVKVGEHITIAQLLEAYDQVVLAVGCEGARKLGIPGEDLPGSHSATAFVGWYNGHPDHQDHVFDLDVEAAVVVGVGNVAMDVTRILVRDPGDLHPTDITHDAVEALRRSRVRDVYVLGRRGPAQAAFSPAEIKEIAELPGVDLVVRPEDAALDPASARWLETSGDRNTKKNVAFLQEIAGRSPTAERRVHLRLYTSPVAYHGEGRLQQVEIERNELVEEGDRLACRGTGERERLAVGLALRAVGYRGVPLPGVPHEARGGTIPNREGRVFDGDRHVERLYVVGWAKRGPQGLIGTNRADARETVSHMLEDAEGLPQVARPELPDAVLGGAVDWTQWEHLDDEERRRGEERGKVREKFVDVGDMIAHLRSTTS